MWICKYSIQPSAYLLKCQWGKSDFELEMFFLGGVISTSNAMGFPSKLWFSRTSSFLTTLWLSSPCWNAVLLLGDYSEKKSPIALVPNIVLYLFRREKDLKKQRRPHSSSRFFSPFCASFTFSVILQWSDVVLFGRFELWWNIFKKKTTVRLPYIWRRFMWWIVDPNFLED